MLLSCWQAAGALYSYLSFGLMSLFFNSNISNLLWSTGLSTRLDEEGCFNNISLGLTGRFSNPPPQFGQTLCNTFSTQSEQKVHSNEQIIASELFVKSSFVQFSQTNRISNIFFSHINN
jgi:hypothetical protein